MNVVLGFLALLLAVYLQAVCAQAYPVKQIRLIVPFAPRNTTVPLPLIRISSMAVRIDLPLTISPR